MKQRVRVVDAETEIFVMCFREAENLVSLEKFYNIPTIKNKLSSCLRNTYFINDRDHIMNLLAELMLAYPDDKYPEYYL